MSLLRCIVVLQCATAVALGQSVPPSKTSDLPNQPEAVVRNLYQQVVARHPVGIPHEADMKVFAPYLSGALLHRIEDAKACEADWRRQHPDPTLKLPGLDYGLFSGGGLGGLHEQRLHAAEERVT